MAYAPQAHHIEAATTATYRYEAAGEKASDHLINAESWDAVRSILNAEDATEKVSVASLSDAPYRILFGDSILADQYGWIDVQPEDEFDPYDLPTCWVCDAPMPYDSCSACNAADR